MTVSKHHYRIINDSVVLAGIAPYIYIVTHAAHAVVDSGYRGSDAKDLLHKHDKHDQEEIYAEYGPGRANRPGGSTHELKSDGRAYPEIPYGHDLRWWQLGWDITDPNLAGAVIYQGKIRGWEIFQPYPGSSEAHHLNFKVRPRPSHLRADANADRIRHLRSRLPRS